MASEETLIMALTAFGIIFSLSLSFGPILFSAAFSGRYQNKRIDECLQREKDFVARTGGDSLSNLRTATPDREVAASQLIMESLVVGASWWQQLLGWLISLFGGRIESFDRALGLGRREAMQRLRESAESLGYHAVINMRLETSTLAVQKGGKSKVAGIEVLAFGTAIRYAD